MIIILSRILLLVCCGIVVFKMPLLYLPKNLIYFRLLLIFLITIEVIVLFKNFFISKKANALITNIFTTLLSFFLIFIALESFFMFYPRSHGAGETLAARLWAQKYCSPSNFNSFGFRDIEPGNSDSVILFVGDSFTEGDGLENPEDRFSNIVRNELLSKNLKYSIVNIGVGGLDTRGEYDTMLRFIDKAKIKPQKIILQYYGNDIERVAQQNGIKFQGFSLYSDVPRVLLPIVKGSYFINFVYWMLPKPYETPYTDFLIKAYKNNGVLSKHKNDLKLFIDYANENTAQLIVVVFPFIENIELSKSLYVDDIVSFFSENGVPTINVGRLIKDMPLKDRIVNLNDGHASKKVNRIVAQEILSK